MFTGGCWNNDLKIQSFIEFKEIPGFRIVINILVTLAEFYYDTRVST